MHWSCWGQEMPHVYVLKIHQEHLFKILLPYMARDWWNDIHYDDVIMGAMMSQITSLTIVYSTVCSGAGQSKHQAPRHWPLCGELPVQVASNAENVSIGWHHHVDAYIPLKLDSLLNTHSYHVQIEHLQMRDTPTSTYQTHSNYDNSPLDFLGLDFSCFHAND